MTKNLFICSILSLPLCAGATPAEDLNAARSVSNAMADTVEKVLPSVVVIRTEATRVYLDQWRARFYQAVQPLGQGSGVLISAEGFILTNGHVIQGAETIEVALDDGRIFPATLVGVNPQTDIAVIKITPEKDKPFKPIQPGDSEKIRVGEFVMAIGSPYSLTSTVTNGIISQKGRTSDMLPVVDFLQTSAPINPGNSGGPLVDLEGRLIGINTFIKTAPGEQGNIGIGFAVPSRTALRIADLLIKGEDAQLGWVGIEMQDLYPEGVGVMNVVAGSPAEKAGLRPRDILVGIDGRRIANSSGVRSYVSLKQAGDRINLKAVRGGKEADLAIDIEPMPDLNQRRR
ncbi:MAG: trypsin-like peptidase domain-containing protein [Kiritimatiellia bacterium]